MNSMALLLVLTAPGIEYGWQPGPDGKLEYIIQLEPEALEALRGGEPISSDIHPDARGVRRFVLRVGDEAVPRIAIPPEAIDTQEDGAATEPANSTQPNRGRTNTQRQPGNRTNPAGSPAGQPSATIQGGGANQNRQQQRSAPPLLRGNERNDTSATDTVLDTEQTGDDGNYGQQFTLTDDATEDGGGAYGSVPTPSRYSRSQQQQQPRQPENEQQQTDDADEGSIWSRWNSSEDQSEDTAQWQPFEQQEPRQESAEPPVLRDNIPDDPDAMWAQQTGRPDRLGVPDEELAEFERWRKQRNAVKIPEVARREGREFVPAGYSSEQSFDRDDAEGDPGTRELNNVNNDGNPNSATQSTGSQGETPALQATTTEQSNDLFKELLLFASLGVNVVAVVIARQYYMRYCMLVHELRESESLAA